jgi:hypothetical protein
MSRSFFNNYLTRNQSIHLLNVLEILHELPKGKEIVVIVPPIGQRDYTKITIEPTKFKNSQGEKLFHWKHYNE